ncbi:putative ABC transporter ATP-binding protein YbbL [compost metagenome]
MNPIFELRNVSKSIRDQEGQPSKRLFSNITVEITRPERIALIGASGQGKSTLLRLMALLDAPDDGELRLDGKASRETDPRQWRMEAAYVAQQAVMLPGSIEDNLRTVSVLHGTPYNQELAARLMEQLGLEYLDPGKQASDCSGGEKQRISLIRTMLLQPRILLLDEITASLDVNSARRVEELLTGWHSEEGGSYIWVTHDLEQAQRISDKVWVMSGGGLHEYSGESFFSVPIDMLAKQYIQPAEGSLPQ